MAIVGRPALLGLRAKRWAEADSLFYYLGGLIKMVRRR